MSQKFKLWVFFTEVFVHGYFFSGLPGISEVCGSNLWVEKDSYTWPHEKQSATPTSYVINHVLWAAFTQHFSLTANEIRFWRWCLPFWSKKLSKVIFQQCQSIPLVVWPSGSCVTKKNNKQLELKRAEEFSCNVPCFHPARGIQRRLAKIRHPSCSIFHGDSWDFKIEKHASNAQRERLKVHHPVLQWIMWRQLK